jgi:hypothetical protein
MEMLQELFLQLWFADAMAKANENPICSWYQLSVGLPWEQSLMQPDELPKAASQRLDALFPLNISGQG